MHACSCRYFINHATVIHLLLLSKFHLATKNFKLSCVQLMISSGSPLNVLHFSSYVNSGYPPMKERRKVGSFYYRFLTGERLCLSVCLSVTLSVCTLAVVLMCMTSGYRVSTFLETLYRDMEKGGCGDNALLVSHGLFCRLFLTSYFHWRVNTVQFHLCSSIPCSVMGNVWFV